MSIEFTTSAILHDSNVLAGAGGFVGGHLVGDLADQRIPVIGVNLKRFSALPFVAIDDQAPAI